MDTHIELRSLKSDDVFVMATIISKIGFKEFRSCFETPEVKALVASKKEGNKSVDANKVGMTIAFEGLGIIMANLEKVKDDVYSFLSSLSGMSKKEVSDLPIATFMQMIVDVFQKEDFNDFFMVVSKFLK